MRRDPSYRTQLTGCLRFQVDSSHKAAQDLLREQGVIEAIAEAMRLFPEDKTLIVRCTGALAGAILFNRESGLRAGRLGALNHTLHIYMTHMDDPEVMNLGGAIGAYFDYVDENRRIAAELGGIQAIIQNIRNHFHGRYGEWSYEPVKQSLFALSSGCWVNQDICFDEGFPELAVRLMAEHGHETKIAEETMQVTKALISRSDAYRQRLADLNITDSMVHVMRVNEHDRGALDLSCENFAWLVGPVDACGPSGCVPRAFRRDIQLSALRSGALPEILRVVTEGREMHHNEHEAFNFDVDAAYNVRRDCYSALLNLGRENAEARASMLQAGLVSAVRADLAQGPEDWRQVTAGCGLLRDLGHKAGAPPCL